FWTVWGSRAPRVPVDPAGPAHGGLCPVFYRFLLDSPAAQTPREQARPLQRNPLLRAHHHGQPDPNGSSRPPAVAHDPGLVAGPEHAGVNGTTADVAELTRTAREWPAAEIAAPPRR